MMQLESARAEPIEDWPRSGLPELPRQGGKVAYFLLQGSYTSEAWKGLVSNPTDRIAVVRPVVEKLGGKLEQAWFAFGEYDLVTVLQLPDNVSAAAFSLAIAAGGGFKAHKTTPLLTIADGIEAMKKAGTSGYLPPK